MSSGIHVKKDGALWLITLDRPKANAIDQATSRSMWRSFIEFRDDPDARVAILTGAGNRFFSAGWDLKAVASGAEENADYGGGGFAGLTEEWTVDKPIIAAVNGMALGGGFELALACDMIIAAEHATFALPEALRGLVADAGGIVRLPRRLPRVIANEMLMTGRSMDAQEALRWGLINKIVAADQLESAARELAQSVIKCAPMPLRAIKHATRLTSNLSEKDAFAFVASGKVPVFLDVAGSEDAKEGVSSLLEKREPLWRNR